MFGLQLFYYPITGWEELFSSACMVHMDRHERKKEKKIMEEPTQFQHQRMMKGNEEPRRVTKSTEEIYVCR